MTRPTTAHLSVRSPLGDLTLFEDAGAIVALEWGRAPAARPTPLLKRAEKQLGEYFSGRRLAFDLPIETGGTDFQKRVWRELARIPLGVTRSYGDIAKKLKTSARAVGTACGRNPVPVLIPCHRVVGSGGRLGGFSAMNGIETKARMLALEAEIKAKKAR